ncbi:glycosyltransferase family 2 protein [Pseudophaeobacter sp.]|uniref:glycosyltransferase family 2 protein n=1 Tax=Pseudophaeobacter sp. TaxID=1971739 RepID=UPI003A987129
MKTAAVVPCFKTRHHALSVVERLCEVVDYVFVVDDCCPQGTGAHIAENCDDPRVTVMYHASNQGVGGAVITGYRAAAETDASIFVKVDSDGQMDPALIPALTAPLRKKSADYSKGNRFYHRSSLKGMPKVRLFGNAALSFLTKMSSGYWNVMDPTNGFTAIHISALNELDLDAISTRYFFESDMLHHLNLARAVIHDVPMRAIYADEVSSLRIREVLGSFFFRNLRNTTRRIFYTYGLRNFSVGSAYLLFSAAMLAFSIPLGLYTWAHSIATGVPATSGTVMLVALPTLLGIQFLSGFINFDVSSAPRIPLQETTDV